MPSPELTTRVLLIRHATAGDPGVLHGHVDVPLTPDGRAEAERLALRLRGEPVGALYASDLRRARETAEILGQQWGLRVVEEPALRELHMGRWDGKPVQEVLAAEEDLVRQWWSDLERFATPGGESLADLAERAVPAFERIVTQHPGETVAVVAHGGTNRVILFRYLGIPLARYHVLAQDPACLNRLVLYPDGNTVVELVNG
ncbi:histidine phosphatase family protein [Deferrisoma sp.]